MLESVFDKAAGLKTCNSFKKRLQNRCFPVKFPNFLEHPFLQKSSGGCFWGLIPVLKEFGAKTGATVSNKYQIQLKNLLPRKFRSRHRRCSVKEGPAQTDVFL